MLTLQTNWNELADKSIRGELLNLKEGLSVLEADDDEVLALMQAAFKVRKHYYGKKVKLNLIINAKSGFARRTAATARNRSYRRRRFKNIRCWRRKRW